MCLSTHLRSVTTESVDGSRLSAHVSVQGDAYESTIRNVIAIPWIFKKSKNIFNNLIMISGYLTEIQPLVGEYN